MPNATDTTVSGEPSPGPRWKAVLGRLVKWLVFVVVLAVVGRVVVLRFAEVSWSEVHFRAGWLVASLVAGLAAAGIAFLPYHLLLKSFGQEPPVPAVMTSVWVAQVGKYLPGKMGSVVGLMWLLRRHGVRVGVSAGVVVMAAGLLVILGMLIAVPLALYEPIRAQVPMAGWWCLALVALGVICLHPHLLGTLCNVVLRWLRQDPLPRLPRVRDLGWPILALLGQFCLAGTALWLLGRAFADVDVPHLPLFIGGSSLATVGGFLSFFAPAGIGVHEGLLLVVLGPLMGGPSAAIVVVANRFVKTAGEAALAAVGLVLRRLVPSLRLSQAKPEPPGD